MLAVYVHHRDDEPGFVGSANAVKGIDFEAANWHAARAIKIFAQCHAMTDEAWYAANARARAEYWLAKWLGLMFGR